MKELNRKNLGLQSMPPISVVQFGEGNFLRAFVEYAFQRLNKEVHFNAGIAVVQPIEKGMVSLLNDQDGLYTLFTKGIQKGKEIQERELITNIVRCIDPYTDFNGFLDLAREDALKFVISNTTEAGIAYLENDTADMQPPASFPAKLAVLLYERYSHFSGAVDKGLTIIPCELINHNSDVLKQTLFAYIDKWCLEEGFKNWLVTACDFHNSLVDRIVPGYPREQIAEYNSQLDYTDNLLVCAESFFLWVIEGDERLKQKLPFHKTDLDVIIAANLQPYRTRKVRILNGAHTAMVPISILYGHETVKESVDDAFTGSFIRAAVFGEIIPTLNMDKEALEHFANEVFDRFRNPFIKHQLSSIALNAISKFKVRVLPSLLHCIADTQTLPKHLIFSFACLIRFYKGDWKGKKLPVNDDADQVREMAGIWKSDTYEAIAQQVLGLEHFWGQNLTLINGLAEAMAIALRSIEELGIEKGFKQYVTNINIGTDTT